MKESKEMFLEKCSLLGIKVSKSMSIKTLKEKIEDYESTLKNIKTIEPRNECIVKKVYHLADIHIRYLDRHEEYKEVFSRLIEYIKNDTSRDNSVMIICGDIFHNKDRFISETIIIFDDFLKEISSLLEVFIILGNHDCFNHRDRLDALSGIMQIKKYSNVHLLKESGIYCYNNVVLGVSSIIDGAIMKCPSKLEDKTYIGLYHGIVMGCSLDNEYKTNGLSLHNFENYDFVMLGDVHKKQFLNKEKTIAYPGSLIQQNFKEERDHGFLLWDLETKQSEFVKIDNDYLFIDLDLHEDIDKITFSPYCRVRIIMGMEDLESELKEFIEKVSTKTKILSMKTLFKERILSPTEVLDLEEKSSLESRERDVIRSFVKTEDEYESIIDIHNNLHSTIEQSDMNYKNTLPWSITQIEFMNIFCYGNDHLNKITFNNGITGILAANASGKTNILNTILYGLFGNIYTRNQNQNNRNIISRFCKKNELFVKLTITMSNDEVFYIERRAKGRKRTTTNGDQTLLTETVDFYTDVKNLNLTNKVETEKLIRETLSFSTKDDFILTNMISNISYGANISIISMNGTQLDEIFNNMFNLNKYKLLHNEAKVICKKINQERGNVDAQIELIESKLTSDINIDRVSLNKLSEELTLRTEERNKLSEDLETIYDKISNINKKSDDIKESKELLLSQVKENQEILSEEIFDIDQESFYEKECERLSKILKQSDSTANFLKNKKIENLKERDISDIEKDIAFYEGRKQKIDFSSDITEEYINAKKIIQSYKKEDNLDLNVIKEIILNMKFHKKEQYYTLDRERREIILKDLDKTYINNEDFVKYQKIIDDKEKRDVIIKENIETQQKLSALRTELKNNKINHTHRMVETVKMYTNCLDMIDLHYETEELKEKVKILNNNNEYNELLKKKNKIAEKISTLNQQILKLNTDLSMITSKINTHEKDLIVKVNLQQKSNELEKKYISYKNYMDITHSKNLPKQLITNIVKNICIEANTMIYNMCGLICEIQENEKWEIIIKKQNIIIGPEHCSGYERFVINTSLKIVFDRFKQLPTIKLFLIDEVIDCVSEDNFDQIDNLLFNLKKHYSNVFLISHNDELKKKVENRINIRVDNNCSFIE